MYLLERKLFNKDDGCDCEYNYSKDKIHYKIVDGGCYITEYISANFDYYYAQQVQFESWH